MKKILSYFITLSISMLTVSSNGYSQKLNEIESLEVTEILLSDNRISTEKDGDEFEFVLSDDLKVKIKKGKTATKEFIQAGMLIDVAYEVSDTLYIAKKITILEEQELTFGAYTGFFDYLTDSVAYVGGKKVMLLPGVNIQASDDKNCKCKGFPFKDFSTRPLAYGYSLTIKGKQRADGVILAEKITACKNTLTDDIDKVITEVKDRYEGGKLKHKLPQGYYRGYLSSNGVTYKLHSSDALQEYVTAVGEKLLPAYLNTNEKDDAEVFKYRFLVIENDLPEAFSWPNGMIFINSGLLCSITNEAQLAFVIARELAHINYYHTAKRLKEAKKKNAVINGFKKMLTTLPVFVDKYKTSKDNEDSTVVKNNIEKMLTKYADMLDKGLGSGINRQLIGALILVQDKIKPVELIGQYSQVQEAEADEVALSYMYIAGYDIREALKFWAALLEKIKKPGFKTSVTKSIKKMMPPDLLDAFKGDIKQNLLEKPIEHLVEKIFTSIFTSPKLTQKRLKRIKAIIQNNFPGYELHGKQTNPQRHAAMIAMLKCQ